MSRRAAFTARVALSAAALSVVSLPLGAFAQTVDGVRGTGSLAFGEYQFRLGVQTTASGFSAAGLPENQLDSLHVNVLSNGSLQLMLAGNLNDDFTGLITFLDNGRPGAVRSTNPGGSGNVGSIPGNFSYAWGNRDGADIRGSILAPGFNPSRALQVNGGGPTYYTNYTDISRNSSEFGEADTYIGQNNWTLQGTNTPAGSSTPQNYNYQIPNAGSISGTFEHAFNNSNVLRWDGPGGTNGPTGNDKGYEVIISSGALQLKPGSELKLMSAIVGNGGGRYLSNQFFPAVANPGGVANNVPNLATDGDLNGDGRLFNWTQHPEITFITIPTPTSTAAAHNWFDNASWNTKFAPNGINTQAVLAADLGNKVVTVDGTPTVGTLRLSGPGSVSVVNNGSNNGVINVQSYIAYSDERALIDVPSGTHQIAVPVTIGSNTAASIATGATLTTGSIVSPNRLSGLLVRGGGTLNLTGNYVGRGLDVENVSGAYTSLVNLATSTALVRDGDVVGLRAAVKGWLDTGKGIGSSAVNANTTVAVFPNLALAPDVGFYDVYSGEAVIGTDVIVRRTYIGDTDVNGLLDANDLVNILEGISLGLTGWQNGDNNYDSVVDSVDLGRFTTVLNLGLPSLGGPGEVGQGGGGNAIPEPASLGLMLAGLPLLGRRRTR